MFVKEYSDPKSATFWHIILSIINPMKIQGIPEEMIVSALSQLYRDCSVKLTPLRKELVQQYLARINNRSKSPESIEIINISSDDSSDEESYNKNMACINNNKTKRILSDDEEDSGVETLENGTKSSSVRETEIQVSIKLCGPGNNKKKDCDNIIVNPLVKKVSLPDSNRKLCIDVSLLDNNSQSLSSKVDLTTNNEISLEKPVNKKREKFIECFGEDSDEGPEPKIGKLSNTEKSNMSFDTTNPAKKTTEDSTVKKKKRKRKHSNKETNYSNFSERGIETEQQSENTSHASTNNASINKRKRNTDIKSQNESKLTRKKIEKPRKSSTKENNYSSKNISHDNSNDSSIKTAPKNYSVSHLWSSLGMESPTERSGNFWKKCIPLSVIRQPINSSVCDQEANLLSVDNFQVDSATNTIVENINNLSDQPNIQILPNKIINNEGNNIEHFTNKGSTSLLGSGQKNIEKEITRPCPSSEKEFVGAEATRSCLDHLNVSSKSVPCLEQTNIQIDNTSGHHLEQNIVESEAAVSSDNSTNNKGSETNTNNIGKIRLRDPKTLLQYNNCIDFNWNKTYNNTMPNIPSLLQNMSNNTSVINDPKQNTQQSLKHYNPQKQHSMDLLLSSEVKQKEVESVKEGEDKYVIELKEEIKRWYFDEDLELKSAKMAEILHLVIADKICKDDRVKSASKLMSESSIADEKRRVDREYSETLRIRGSDFKVLFNSIIENYVLPSPNIIKIFFLYCKIIDELLKIEETNIQYQLSARYLICEMLKKNNYKWPLVYEAFNRSDENFDLKYSKLQTIFTILKKNYPENQNTDIFVKEKLSHEQESQISKACNEVSLEFNLRNNLDQLDQNKEVHSVSQVKQNYGDHHQRDMMYGTAERLSRTRQLEASTVEHSLRLSTLNESVQNGSTSSVNPVVDVQKFPNFQITPPVSNTIQAHKRAPSTNIPPAHRSLHIVHQNSNRINLSSQAFLEVQSVENRINCKTQEQNSATQPSGQMNYQAMNGQPSQIQRTQTTHPFSGNISNHYGRKSGESQQSVHDQSILQNLQKQQNGSSMKSQENRIQLGTLQHSQGDNYKRMSSDVQQAQIQNNFRLPPQHSQYLQNNFKVQNEHGSLLSLLMQKKHSEPIQKDNRQTNTIQNQDQSTRNEQNRFNSQNHCSTSPNRHSESSHTGDCNPNSMSYARMRQTSAIQNVRSTAAPVPVNKLNYNKKFQAAQKEYSYLSKQFNNTEKLPMSPSAFHSTNMTTSLPPEESYVFRSGVSDKVNLQANEKIVTQTSVQYQIQSHPSNTTQISQNIDARYATLEKNSLQSVNNATPSRFNENQSLQQIIAKEKTQQSGLLHCSPNRDQTEPPKNISQSHTPIHPSPQRSSSSNSYINKIIQQGVTKKQETQNSTFSPQYSVSNIANQNKNGLINTTTRVISQNKNNLSLSNQRTMTNTSSEPCEGHKSSTTQPMTQQQYFFYTNTLLKHVLHQQRDQNKGIKSAYEQYLSNIETMEQINPLYAAPSQNKLAAVNTERSTAVNCPSKLNNTVVDPGETLKQFHTSSRNPDGTYAAGQPYLYEQRKDNPHQNGRSQDLVSDFSKQIEIHSVHSMPADAFYGNQLKTNHSLGNNKCSNQICFNMAVVLCGGCSDASYCSKNCQEEHWYEGHYETCQSINKNFN